MNPAAVDWIFPEYKQVSTLTLWFARSTWVLDSVYFHGIDSDEYNCGVHSYLCVIG